MVALIRKLKLKKLQRGQNARAHLRSIGGKSWPSAVLGGNLMHGLLHPASPRTNKTGFTILLQGSPAPAAASASRCLRMQQPSVTLATPSPLPPSRHSPGRSLPVHSHADAQAAKRRLLQAAGCWFTNLEGQATNVCSLPEALAPLRLLSRIL